MFGLIHRGVKEQWTIQKLVSYRFQTDMNVMINRIHKSKTQLRLLIYSQIKLTVHTSQYKFKGTGLIHTHTHINANTHIQTQRS